MTRLTRWCFAHRLTVLATWGLLLAVLGGTALSQGAAFRDSITLAHAPSTTAYQLITEQFPAASRAASDVVWHTAPDAAKVTDPTITTATATLLRDIRALPGIATVKPAATSPDQHTAYATITFTTPDATVPAATITALTRAAAHSSTNTLTVAVGGDAIPSPSATTFGLSEIIGVGVAAIVLLIAFGSLTAMLLPLACALVALGASLSVVLLASHAMTLASVSPSLSALIGLGVGIDYALFVVTRYRAALKQGTSPAAACQLALATSGRAVVFAGITVCIALLGLFVTGVSFLYGLALAAAVGVAFTLAVTLTLLPALLSLLGTRVLSRRERTQLATLGPRAETTGSGWLAWAARLQRHPLRWASAALGLVALLTVPFFSLHLGVTDQGGDPIGSTTRTSYDLLADAFGPGINTPLTLLVTNPTPTSLAAIRDAVTALPDVASVTTDATHTGDSPSGSTHHSAALLTVIPNSAATDPATATLVRHLRDTTLPAATAGSPTRVYLGGAEATSDDFTTVLSAKLPIFIAVVIALSALLLAAAFRSLLIPALGAVMNLLAAAATYGVLVAVFQWGWGASLFDVTRPGPIEAFLPVMLFAVLFGLSMDYQVFLVSRMHEEWQRTGDNKTAVARGQADTGRVITAAATIMVAVFTSFVFGSQQVVAMFGLGLATAITLDALVIRTVLVPATMQSLGAANWWLPAWLDRLIPHLNVEAATPSNTPTAQPTEMPTAQLTAQLTAQPAMLADVTAPDTTTPSTAALHTHPGERHLPRSRDTWVTALATLAVLTTRPRRPLNVNTHTRTEKLIHHTNTLITAPLAVLPLARNLLTLRAVRRPSTALYQPARSRLQHPGSPPVPTARPRPVPQRQPIS